MKKKIEPLVDDEIMEPRQEEPKDRYQMKKMMGMTAGICYCYI